MQELDESGYDSLFMGKVGDDTSLGRQCTTSYEAGVYEACDAHTYAYTRKCCVQELTICSP